MIKVWNCDTLKGEALARRADDSGVTLQRVQEHLRTGFPEVSEVRSAVIWYKACSVMRPDYFVEYLPDNPWIHQPFEIYDDMSLDRL